MNLLDSVLTANGGKGVTQLANQFGLSEAQTTSAIQNLLPGIAAGMQHNLGQDGLPGLLRALQEGHHEKYIDDPSTLSSGTAEQDGNGILGHVLGSKEVSRQVAARAASSTGIGQDILKRMLPMIAAMAMGALSKRTDRGGTTGQGSGAGMDITSMLGPLLDRNRDGSVVDDLLGSLFKK